MYFSHDNKNVPKRTVKYQIILSNNFLLKISSNFIFEKNLTPIFMIYLQLHLLYLLTTMIW